MEPVNENVVNGFTPFNFDPTIQALSPKYADPACLSESLRAVWTNRVPEHEPWPRVMKCDGDSPPNSTTADYKKNVRHTNQYDNTTNPAGIRPIGVVEGDENIQRGRFWRR